MKGDLARGEGLAPGGGAIELLAPVSGRLVPLEKVPDPVFAERMAGDGVAIEPETEPEPEPMTVVAPCDGLLAVLFPGGHAMAIAGPGGLEVIVHIGLDTVELAGTGFEVLARQGDQVRAGQPLIRFDPAVLRGRGKRALSPVLVANMDAVERLQVSAGDTVRAGRDVLLTVWPKEVAR
ncbi:MAG: PTS sugar transporter subunit IIA [Bacillota bacterium]